MKNGIISNLNSYNAVRQSILSIVLMSVIPVLSTLYLGLTAWFWKEQLSPLILGSTVISAIVLAATGFLLFLKFPRNVIKLRHYITDIASGVFPDNISLLDASSSDDLKFIENGLNTVLQQMQEKIEYAEEKQRIEHELREIIQNQHGTLIHAEQHRAMVQCLGAACHHIGQPAAVLGMRLHLMKRDNLPLEELIQINECEESLQAIMAILNKLRMVNEFRTEPYIHIDDGENVEILAI